MAQCGEKGNEIRNCPNAKGHRIVFRMDSQQNLSRDTAVVIPVKWNDQPIKVMIDVGAEPSVVDKGTLQAMQIPYVEMDD